MKGHTIFVCANDECPVISFIEWSNQADSPSQSNCPCCHEYTSPLKAIFNKEHP